MARMLLQRCGHFCFQHATNKECSALHHAVKGGNVLCVQLILKFLKKYSKLIVGPDPVSVHVLEVAHSTRYPRAGSFFQHGLSDFSFLEGERIVDVPVVLEWRDDLGRTPLALACSLSGGEDSLECSSERSRRNEGVGDVDNVGTKTASLSALSQSRPAAPVTIPTPTSVPSSVSTSTLRPPSHSNPHSNPHSHGTQSISAPHTVETTPLPLSSHPPTPPLPTHPIDPSPSTPTTPSSAPSPFPVTPSKSPSQIASIVKALISAGSDIGSVNALSKLTPLMEAAAAGKCVYVCM